MCHPVAFCEVNRYGGVDTEHNHVNMYVTTDATSEWYQKVVDQGNIGYGGMTYYTNETCWNGDTSGCTTNYASSQIKYVVDAWKNAKVFSTIDARLIQYNEFKNLGYVEGNITPSDIGLVKSENKPSWVSNYSYWTSSQYNDYSFRVWGVARFGELIDVNIHSRNDIAVRLAIILPKSALSA